MKKILIALNLIASTLFVSAQSIQLDEPAEVVYGTLENPDDVTLEAHWDVINGSSEVLNVRVYREILQLVNNSQERFCWAGVCFNWGTVESPNNVNFIVEMDPEEVDTTFRSDYEHQGNAGVEIIRYCFYDDNDPTIETCHDISYNVSTTGLHENEIALDGMLGSVNPNPVKGIASFDYSFTTTTTTAHVHIYNLVGEKVKTINLQNKSGLVLINAADFDSGVYFYALEANGKTFGTRKLVIAK